jgi:hypothetical protein
MKSYSHSLSTRARWLYLFALTLIALAAAWQNSPRNSDTIFTPEQKIRQIITAGTAIQTLQSQAQPAAQPVTPPCDGRSLKVLQTNLMAAFDQDAASAERQIQLAASENIWSNCQHFSQAFQEAIHMTNAGNFSPALVKEALTEDVTWTRRVPCLLGGSPDQPLFLAGHPLQCRLQMRLNSISTHPVTSSFRQLASGIANTATMAAISGRWSATKPQWISLQPVLQTKLDEWTVCIKNQSCPNTPELLHLRNVALVVLDVKSGAVLATWCHGKACKRAQQQGPGVLPATLIEVPPASTAKLLFAMTIAANDQLEPLVLQRQIKTSGQDDSGVSKRNEWWEKQAVCANTPNRRCLLPVKTRELAEAFGWNAHCTPSNPGCGRWGLLAFDRTELIPGQVGRLALNSLPVQGAVMLDWKLYEDIRQGKRKPQGTDSYTSTSLAIQAVIGAGDSRISALGLASLPMQIWRTAQGMPATLPSLLTSPAPVNLPVLGGEWANAASIVLAGMRKVVQPPEPGWQGAGTAVPAWTREMKQPCIMPCGVWAKTGTVGKSDKVFGGTTTFSALVDVQEWSQWSGQNPSDMLKNRILAIGVVAMPEAQAPRVHAASFLGLAAIRQLLTLQAP